MLNKQILFEEKKNSQKNGYRNQGKNNTSFDIKIYNLLISILNTHNLLLKTTDINNATIPNKILKVNAQALNFGLFVYSGTIIAAPNQPAERLIKRSERTPNQTKPIKFTLTTIGSTVNADQSDGFKLYNLGAAKFGPVTGSP